MGKIKKVESRLQKEARLKHEEILLKHRNLLNTKEGTDDAVRILFTIGADVSRNQMCDILTSNIEVGKASLSYGVIPRKVTLPVVKDITKLADITQKISKYIDKYQGKVNTRSELAKFTEEFNKRFEKEQKQSEELLRNIDFSLKAVFDMVVSYINALMGNFGDKDTLTNSIFKARNAKLITNDQYSVLRAFNTLRNVIAHNSPHAMVSKLVKDLDVVIMIKAIVIEVTTIASEILMVNLDRFSYFVAVYSEIYGLNNSTIKEGMEKTALDQITMIEEIRGYKIHFRDIFKQGLLDKKLERCHPVFKKMLGEE